MLVPREREREIVRHGGLALAGDGAADDGRLVPMRLHALFHARRDEAERLAEGAVFRFVQGDDRLHRFAAALDVDLRQRAEILRVRHRLQILLAHDRRL